MRNLTREDRDAFTRAEQKEWASWLDNEAVESPTKPHPSVVAGC